MAIDPLPRLTVYSRRGCHLCEDMIAGLRQLQMRNSLEFETVDIDVDPAVARRYRDKVPVLAYGDRELCQYYLEPAVITAFLAELR